ncbi:MAG TPA: hypothetical protein VFG47_12840 [Geminicoccaceae bacterium]|nr:hypothetical protein [Geminicoccaceae bacterium]
MDEYIPVPGTIFSMSLAIPLAHRSGFKLHVSVDPADADELARLVLPTLRLLHVHHKVVQSQELYQWLSSRSQRGKFITVYPGPAGPAQRVVDTLDPTLVARRFRRGPVPATRQSGHTTHEVRVGQSGMISCYWCESYAED